MQLILFAFLVLASVARADTTGFWWWTWGGVNNAPSGTTLSVAFSGQVNPTLAISDSAPIVNKMPGTKYLSLGGGNAAGHWSASNLATLTAAINAGTIGNAGYQGVVYDIEEGDAGLSSAFATSFAACKAKGLKVLVTISHSAPYGVTDAATLMASFMSNTNIDILSPQLYTTGYETSNDYTLTAGVTWQSYASARATIMPAIVSCSLYANAKATLQSYGMTVTGFIQWDQAASCGPPTPPSPVAPPSVQPCADPSQCKSQYGYCGTGAAYCGTGCQAGPCYSNPPVAPPPTTGVPPPTAPPPVSPPPTTGVPPPTAPPPSGSNGCPAANPCKSKWGYCGSTAAYCGTDCVSGPCWNQRVAGEDAEPSTGLSTGALVGIIVGCVVGVVVVVGLVAFAVFKIRKPTSDSV